MKYKNINRLKMSPLSWSMLCIYLTLGALHISSVNSEVISDISQTKHSNQDGGKVFAVHVENKEEIDTAAFEHARVKRMGENEDVEVFDDLEGSDSNHYPVSTSISIFILQTAKIIMFIQIVKWYYLIYIY